MIPALRVKLEHEMSQLPFRSSAESAGLDIYAIEDCQCIPNIFQKIDVGLCMAIPCGYFGMVANRSSMIVKEIEVQAGIIDADYRGRLFICLKNRGQNTYNIKQGDRIAQLLILPIFKGSIINDDVLSQTIRGIEGFGSSGK